MALPVLALALSLPLPARGDDVDTAAVVRVLEERCLRCHGPEKRKGHLRVDLTAELEARLVPGKPEESELVRRISLPEDDDDVMPASGDPLTADQIELLASWVAAGAPPLDFAAAGRAEREADLALLAEVSEATRLRLEPLGDAPRAPLRADGSLARTAPPAAGLAALAPLAQRLVELSLAGQPLDAATLAALPPLPALERAHLERTGLDDDGLARFLERAPALTYLNLHSTAVTRRSLPALSALARLRRLVLHGTQLAGPALPELRAALPGALVTGDGDLPAEPFGAGGPRCLLLADASRGRIALLRETALSHYDVLWQHPIEEIHDLQVLPDGHVLFQETWTRMVEVDPRTGEVVWSYDAATANRSPGDGRVEVHAFRRLPDGATLIAESGPARLLEVDREGRPRLVVPLTVDRPDPHHDTRLVRKTPAGTYLVAHEADGVVREYDAQGNVVWSFDVPLGDHELAPGHGFEAYGDQVFSAERRPDGNTLIGTGNGHSVLEVSPAGEIVWRLDQDDLPGIRLAWVTTVQPLANGHLVVGNCHAGPDQPQLVELTREKEVVWTFRDFELFGNALSNAWVVEDAGPDELQR